MNAALSLPLAASSEFDYWWQAQGEWVEPPNSRRDGHSGVQLLSAGGASYFCKRQRGHLCRSLRAPWGEPTVARELRAYRAFAACGVKVPALVFGECRREHGQWQALLVTRPLAGFVDLPTWLASSPSAARQRALVRALARSLQTLHRAGWQHGGLYPKHIFVAETERGVEVALLDLERARQRFSAALARRQDLRQLQRRWGLSESLWLLFQVSYQRV